MSPRLLLPFLVLAVGCDLLPQSGPAGQRRPNTPADEARALYQQGQLDAALQKFQELPSSPESLYYQGAIWSKRAKAAPPPTPPPPPSPVPRRYKPPPPPEFKQEELRAIKFFEQAIAQNPEQSQAHLGLAELLAPHAERVHLEREEAAKTPRRRRPAPSPTPEEAVPDFTPERVLASYQAALRTAPGSEVTAYRVIDFAVRVGQVEAAEATYLTLYGWNQEDPERILRYGDFLRDHKEDPQSAIERYREAMIWKPDDAEIPARIAGIYISFGEEHFERKELIAAENNFREASKYIRDWKTEQGRKVQDYLSRFRRRNR